MDRGSKGPPDCIFRHTGLQKLYQPLHQMTYIFVILGLWSPQPQVQDFQSTTPLCRGVGRGYSKRNVSTFADGLFAYGTHLSPTISSALHHSYGQLHPLLSYHLTPNAFTNLTPKNNTMLLINSIVMACKLPLLLTNTLSIHILDEKLGQKLQSYDTSRHTKQGPGSG